MGVVGWTRFLAEEGWIPNNRNGPCCSTSLWRHTSSSTSTSDDTTATASTTQQHQLPYHHHDSTSSSSPSTTISSSCYPMSLEERYETIPNGSVLHIDGHGLAFHLYRVAYARHIQSILQKSNNNPSSYISSSSSSCQILHSKLKKYSSQQVQDLFPNYLPLQTLHQVTLEFVSTLQQSPFFMQLIIYWDGDYRHAVKTTTTIHRLSRVEDEWDRFYEYCTTGRIPYEYNHHHNSTPKNKIRLCTWEYLLPKSRLFKAQIIHTLLTCSATTTTNGSNGTNGSTTTSTTNTPSNKKSVQMIFCPEEADPVMAEAVSIRNTTNKDNHTIQNHYIIGNDSDFCFFKNVQYIPLNTLWAPSSSSLSSSSSFQQQQQTSGATYPIFMMINQNQHHLQDHHDTTDEKRNTISGCVIRRSDLAHYLQLPNEDAMIELAILLGNDYIFPNEAQLVDMIPTAIASNHSNGVLPTTLITTINPILARSVSECLTHIRSMGIDYQVHSVLPQVQEALRFVRKLYNLQDLSEFPLEEEDKGQLIAKLAINNPNEDNNGTTSRTLTIPEEINLELAQVDIMKNAGVKDAVLQCLQDYINTMKLKNESQSNSNNNQDTNPIIVTTTKMMITQEQLNVFQSMTLDYPSTTTTTTSMNSSNNTMTAASFLANSSNHNNNNNSKQNWRPSWDDIVASYIIEKVMSEAIESCMNTIYFRFCSAMTLFDQKKFHTLLWEQRNKNNNNSTQQPSHLQLQAQPQVQQQNPSNKNRINTKNHKNLYASHQNTNNGYQSSFSFTTPNNTQQLLTTTNPEMMNVVSDDDEYNSSVDDDKISIPEEKTSLPVDEYEEIILDSIKKNRVTIIHGETGCGKSTRIPIMILRAPSPDPSIKQVKLFISQPRRIAAKALVERLRKVEPDLQDVIALRMGHGVREYESSNTKAWFVTTGYLVRLLAKNPTRFNTVTHLIIDEVHERSVDTDILCLLCRRLLATNQSLRLVLMSATLAAALYQEYFKVPHPPIRVGARRFPVKEVYLDELLSGSLPSREATLAKGWLNECLRLKCQKPPSGKSMENAYALAAYLATTAGIPGSSVLVFVPGMIDIVSITELIERVIIPGIRFTCFPVHSELPFEDQMNAFLSPASDEVKIVIATNAAESSVTMPDVDVVICLGLCKQIVYNEASHRQMLQPAWISRASATQRAGRTGRVRPGTAFRLYPRLCYESYMLAFEPGEMLRTPLDSVILTLKDIFLDEQVTEVLLNCLEPPELKTIDRSFESLHQASFITSADDSGSITNLGTFVLALGIDLTLGALVGLGIQFGVGAEALQLAAILSFPMGPWVLTNPVYHEAKIYNEQTAKTFVSKVHFDANLYSEPLSIMNLLWEYANEKDRPNWCWKYGVHPTRVRRLFSTDSNMRRRVADFFGLNEERLQIEAPPLHMSHAKVTLLRIIQAWVFHDTIIECKPEKHTKATSADSMSIELLRKSDQIEEVFLTQVLRKERHPFRLEGFSEIEHTIHFDVASAEGFFVDDFVPGFTERLFSYVVEKDLMFSWYKAGESFALLIKGEEAESERFQCLSESFQKLSLVPEEVAAVKVEGKLRGIAERPCGTWRRCLLHDAPNNKHFWLLYHASKGQVKSFKDKLKDYTSKARGMCFDFSHISPGTMKAKLMVVTKGCNLPAEFDFRDLLASSKLDPIKQKTILDRQQLIVFPHKPSTPIGKALQHVEQDNSSWNRPFMHCAPEGARLLAVLASGNRREHVFHLTKQVKNSQNETEDIVLAVHPKLEQTRLNDRWKRYESSKQVFIESNSVPASALPMDKPHATLYCCCANTLEVCKGNENSSKLRVEGLTLLPPGNEFLALCRLTFGLGKPAGDYSDKFVNAELEARAVAFQQSAMELGEKLQCFPEKVIELLSIFDGIDGYRLSEWKGLSCNPFIDIKLGSSHRVKVQGPRDDARNTDRSQTTANESTAKIPAPSDESRSTKRSQTTKKEYRAEVRGPSDESRIASRSQTTTKKSTGQATFSLNVTESILNQGNGPIMRSVMDGNTLVMRSLVDTEWALVPSEMFDTSLLCGFEEIQLSTMRLPSTKVFALLYEHFQLRGNLSGQGWASLTGPNWAVAAVDLGHVTCFWAQYNDDNLKLSKLARRKISSLQLTTLKFARTLIPKGKEMPFVAKSNSFVVSIDGKPVVVFKTVELAVTIGAALWLEQLFGTQKKYWHQKDFNFLLEKMQSFVKKSKT